MQKTFQRVIPIPAAQYWQSYFDPAHLAPMYEAVLGTVRIETLDDAVEENGNRHRRLRIVPEFRGVQIIQKLFGESRAYVEDGRLEGPAGRWQYQVTPSMLAERIRIRGTHTTRALGERETEVVIVLDVEVRIPVLGSVLERWIGGQFMDGAARQIPFTAAWRPRPAA